MAQFPVVLALCCNDFGLDKTQWTNSSRWHDTPDHHCLDTSYWIWSSLDPSYLHSSSRLWDLDFQVKLKMYFHLKRGLWTVVQVFFSSSAQVRLSWRSVWFRSDLAFVVHFLYLSVCGGSWCSDSSLSPLPVKILQLLESAFLCAPFPKSIYLNLLWSSSLWTASLFTKDLLLLSLLAEGVTKCLLDNCRVSIFTMIVAVCTELDWEIHGTYTTEIVIYSNLKWNIGIFWDLFWAVGHNYINQNKKMLETFEHFKQSWIDKMTDDIILWVNN